MGSPGEGKPPVGGGDRRAHENGVETGHQAGDERPPADDRHRAVPPATSPDDDEEHLANSPFPHPPWTVGLVLVGGAITLLFGLLVSPIWLLVGSPFVIALLLWAYVRLFARD